MAILVWLFLAGANGWKSLLMDGDTGWHIRTGEYILDHHSVPTRDLYSFTRSGAPWFAWEWLSDVVFGLLFRLAGLKAIVLFCGVLIAVSATILLRTAFWRGANALVALPVTMLAIGASSMHFLARPHLFTLVMLPLAIWVIEADRRRPGADVWWLVPLTALWTNLHGGFVIFLVCLALLTIGCALERWPNSESLAPVMRYALLLGACCFATLINPYGTGLHVHVSEYLRAGWIRDLVQEFQAPSFRSEGQLQFEVLLVVGLVLTCRLLATKRIVESLWLVFLAHSSLISVRHAPLYAAVAAPILASELSTLFETSVAGLRRSALPRILFDLGRDLAPGFRRNTPWVAVVILGIAFTGYPIAWPKDFPSEAFPVAIIGRHQDQVSVGHLLTTDQWADYLIYRSPRCRVFIDGRSDFYGETLGREYLALMNGSYSAVGLVEKYQFDHVLIPVDWPMATILKHQRPWFVVEDDGHAILFARHATLRTGRPNENASFGRSNKQETTLGK